MVIVVYKAILVGVLSVVAPHTPLQLFLALLICTAYMLLVLKAAPYITQNLDTLSFLCSLSLSSTMLIGALKSTNDYKTGPEEGKEGIGNISYNLLGPMLIGMNALPFIHLIYTIVAFQLVRRKETAVIVRSKSVSQGKRNRRYSVSPTAVMPLGKGLDQKGPEASELAFDANSSEQTLREEECSTPEQAPRLFRVEKNETEKAVSFQSWE